MINESRRGQPFTKNESLHCKCFSCDKVCRIEDLKFPPGWRAVTHVISRTYGGIDVVEGVWVCSEECSRSPAVEQWRAEQRAHHGAEPERRKSTGEYTTAKSLDAGGDYPVELLRALAELPQAPNDVVEADEDL